MALLFFGELIFLFLLSRSLTSELSFLFYRIFRSRKFAVILMSIVFLPGTIIHEFSHAIMAKILFVYVGKMNLMPQLNGESLKLGSVEVGKTDIIRNFFIGVAPFFVGTGLLLGVLYFFVSSSLMGVNVFTLLVIFFTFVVSNTMYSSKKDMEGAVEFFILVLTPVVLLYFSGVRIPIPKIDLESYFRIASLFLAFPIVIDLGVIIFAKVLNNRV